MTYHYNCPANCLANRQVASFQRAWQQGKKGKMMMKR